MNEFNSEMTLKELRGEIVKFNNDHNAQKLKTYYNEKTYPEILGVSRRELSHSSFLAWMIDPVASHRLDDFGVRRLIEILIVSKFWQSNTTDQLMFDDLITGNFKIVSSLIKREASIGNAGRVDILVEFQLVKNHLNKGIRIIIENKVLSTEGKDQTKKYFDYFSNLNDSFVNLFVYLTPLSSLELYELLEPECESKKFIQINYQELVDSLLEPAMDQSIDDATRLVIGQYIQSLSQPSMDEEENDFERGMIMAIGKEERELLQKFWINNQKVIQAALYAISSDPNQDKDVRDTVGKALLSIATTGKDKSTIIIQYDGINQSKIQKSDLGYTTVQILHSKGHINDRILDWLLEDTSCSFKLIKTKENITENEAKYSKYRVKNKPEFIYNNIGYYVARNWGISNIGNLITKIEGKFPQIKYIIDSDSKK